jgi:hypothetical protein
MELPGRCAAEFRASLPGAGAVGRSRAAPFAVEPTIVIGRYAAGAAHASLGRRGKPLPELARRDRPRPSVSAGFRTTEVPR